MCFFPIRPHWSWSSPAVGQRSDRGVTLSHPVTQHPPYTTDIHTLAKFWNLREGLRNGQSGRCRQEHRRGNHSIVVCRLIFICLLHTQTSWTAYGQDLGWASCLLHQKWGRERYIAVHVLIVSVLDPKQSLVLTICSRNHSICFR